MCLTEYTTEQQNMFYKEFKRQVSIIYDADLSINEKIIKLQAKKTIFKKFEDCFDRLHYEVGLSSISNMIYYLKKEKKEKKEKEKKKILICAPYIRCPYENFLDTEDINEVLRKIGKIKNQKNKNHWRGFFNLLSDKNLVYNNLYTRNKILKELKDLKSFNDFKVVYIKNKPLKKEYRHLLIKGDCIKDYTKLIYLNKFCYILKTVQKDGIELKAICAFNSVNKVYQKPEKKCWLSGKERFNVSCLDAWKHLNKENNIMYYAWCNEHGLNKTNRDLLKKIRHKKEIKPFYVFIEEIEEMISIISSILSLNESIEKLEHENAPIDLICPLEDRLNELRSENDLNLSIKELEFLLYKKERQLLSFTEENNSLDIETTLKDYY